MTYHQERKKEVLLQEKEFCLLIFLFSFLENTSLRFQFANLIYNSPTKWKKLIHTSSESALEILNLVKEL